MPKRDDCPNEHGDDNVIECWSPGGPCDTDVCELCGPCLHCSDVARFFRGDGP